MSIDFPNNLKFNRLSYGANILLHLRGREDLNMGTIGQRLQPLLAGYRQILPQYLEQFFEQMSGLLKQLEKYANLAEACSKSGAYQDKRQEQLNLLLTVMLDMEKQEDVMRSLENMRRV